MRNSPSVMCYLTNQSLTYNLPIVRDAQALSVAIYITYMCLLTVHAKSLQNIQLAL